MNPQNVIASSRVENESSFFSQLLTASYFPAGNKDLTIIASSCSVLALMLLGSCLWCFTHYCKRRKRQPLSFDSPESSFSEKSKPFFEGWQPEFAATDEKPTKPVPSPHKMNGKGGPKVGVYKSVITPDKSIEFVIPTVSLPAQPISSDREIGPELPSCSKVSLSGSETSIIPRDFYPELVQGEEDRPKIGFNLYYEAASQILYVRLLGGKNMPREVRHCIVVKLYPGRGGKQRTREFQESGPIYNQEFSFHIRKATVCTRILRFKAVLLETPKKLIGSLNLALKDLPGFSEEDSSQDLQSNQIWKFLEDGSESVEGVRLRISIQWENEPQPGLLTLRVLEATGLHASSGHDYTSTHVKVTLQEQGRHIKSRKTKLVRWGSVPVYDDVFVVTIPQDLLTQISFILEIVARGRLGSKVCLGKVSIGPMPFAGASGEGVQLWDEMCHQPNTEITKWLQLFQ